MKLHHLNRKVHYWASVFIAAPLLVIVCTGILLQVKKNFDGSSHRRSPAR